MANTYTNWIFEKGTVFERDKIALERAKRMEKRDEKKGYRWIKINDKNRLFVPCDKNGEPTKEGERKIQLFKNALGIK